MSIKWYKNSGRRVLSPKRDNPKAPKKFPFKKPKKGPGVRSPGVRKPYVKVPFIKSAGQVRKNTSLGGLSAMAMLSEIGAEMGWGVTDIRWIFVPKDEHKCRPARKNLSRGVGGDPTPICLKLASMTWSSLEDLQRVASEQNSESKRDDGLWALSHVNCTCFINITFTSQRFPGAKLVYKVSTNDISGLGYSLNEGASIFKSGDGQDIRKYIPRLDGHFDTSINRMNTTEDKDMRAELRSRHDSFGQQVAFDNDRELGSSEVPEEVLQQVMALEPLPTEMPDDAADVEPVEDARRVVKPAPEAAPQEPKAPPAVMAPGQGIVEPEDKTEEGQEGQ